jgi:hypothetical protein
MRQRREEQDEALWQYKDAFGNECRRRRGVGACIILLGRDVLREEFDRP